MFTWHAGFLWRHDIVDKNRGPADARCGAVRVGEEIELLTARDLRAITARVSVDTIPHGASPRKCPTSGSILFFTVLHVVQWFGAA